MRLKEGAPEYVGYILKTGEDWVRSEMPSDVMAGIVDGAEYREECEMPVERDGRVETVRAVETHDAKDGNVRRFPMEWLEPDEGEKVFRDMRKIQGRRRTKPRGV